MMKQSAEKIILSGLSADEDIKRSDRKTVGIDQVVYIDEGSDVIIVRISLIGKLWVGLTNTRNKLVRDFWKDVFCSSATF